MRAAAGGKNALFKPVRQDHQQEREASQHPRLSYCESSALQDSGDDHHDRVEGLILSCRSVFLAFYFVQPHCRRGQIAGRLALPVSKAAGAWYFSAHVVSVHVVRVVSVLVRYSLVEVEKFPRFCKGKHHHG